MPLRYLVWKDFTSTMTPLLGQGTTPERTRRETVHSRRRGYWRSRRNFWKLGAHLKFTHNSSLTRNFYLNDVNLATVDVLDCRPFLHKYPVMKCSDVSFVCWVMQYMYCTWVQFFLISLCKVQYYMYLAFVTSFFF